ncbi:MAG: MOSC domain-containing protein [Propionibacteriales bacterium]|nr:MOSC domain-containing protein [Propionibacteriales bacterium]
MSAVGSVGALYRYPVKSLRGQPEARLDVDLRGVRDDRRWALHDEAGKLGSGKSTRRFRRMDGLLELSAAYDDGVPVVTFPDGRRLDAYDDAVHDALSAHVGLPVRLTEEGDVSHFDGGPVHLVTTASLRQVATLLGEPVDVRRFRCNLVVDTPGLDGFVEEGWIGRPVTIGNGAVLRVVEPVPRCVMVTHAQDDLPVDTRVLKTVADANDNNFGVIAEVVRPGAMAVGDPVSLG